MDIHKNARLSFRSRESLSQVCDRAGGHAEGGCSRLPRQRQDGRQVDCPVPRRWPRWIGRTRSSRPHRSPRRLPDSLAHHVVQLRCQRLPGYLIAHRTGLSPASVSRILRRARLQRWREPKPAATRAAL